jgi:hypothetical protein
MTTLPAVPKTCLYICVVLQLTVTFINIIWSYSDLDGHSNTEVMDLNPARGVNVTWIFLCCLLMQQSAFDNLICHTSSDTCLSKNSECLYNTECPGPCITKNNSFNFNLTATINNLRQLSHCSNWL